VILPRAGRAEPSSICDIRRRYIGSSVINRFALKRADPMTQGLETELKFLISDDNLQNIKSLVSSVKGASPSHRQHLEALYFDTQQQDLWKSGFTLRVRTNGKSHVQTVKRIVSSHVQRQEWEAEVKGTSVELEQIKNTPLAPLIAKPRIRRDLGPAFKIDIERTSWMLDAEAAQIEASLDRGFIEANDKRLSVCELELELKRGDRLGLFALARTFVSRAPLHPSLLSKGERGHLLAQGQWGHAIKVSGLHLEKEMTSRQAFQKIFHTCLHDFQLNQSGFVEFNEAEAVHQARIAIRRLRAAMVLFRPLVSDLEYRKLLGELKWLAGLLGAARDMDVLAESLPLLATQIQASTQPGELTAHLEAKHHFAHQALVEALESERGRMLLFDLAIWIEDGKWHSQVSGSENDLMTQFVRARLKKRRKKLVEQGTDLINLPPHERHQVRIEAKKLRYMAEFFLDVRGVAKDPKQFKQLIDCCENLQGALGEIRDEEERVAFMEAEAAENPANTTAPFPGSFAADGSDYESFIKKQLQRAVRSYKKLVRIQPFC
jgi:triphosphatase